MLVVPADLALFFSGFSFWGRTVIAIAVASSWWRRCSAPSGCPWRCVGLIFEIAGGYGVGSHRVRRSIMAASMPAPAGSRRSPSGRCLTVVVPTQAAPGAPGRAGHRRARARPGRWRDGVRTPQFRPEPSSSSSGSVPIIAGGSHGLCRAGVGVRAGHRGQTRASSGAVGWRKSSARAGWGGLAHPASDTEQGRQPSSSSGRRSPRRKKESGGSIRRGASALRAQGAGDRPSHLTSYGGLAATLGVADDGAFYYVMELLDRAGHCTAPALRPPHPPSRPCLPAAAGVSFRCPRRSHCGLVHRDIETTNIFLCRYGEEFRLREGARVRDKSRSLHEGAHGDPWLQTGPREHHPPGSSFVGDGSLVWGRARRASTPPAAWPTAADRTVPVFSTNRPWDF